MQHTPAVTGMVGREVNVTAEDSAQGDGPMCFAALLVHRGEEDGA